MRPAASSTSSIIRQPAHRHHPSYSPSLLCIFLKRNFGRKTATATVGTPLLCVPVYTTDYIGHRYYRSGGTKLSPSQAAVAAHIESAISTSRSLY